MEVKRFDIYLVALDPTLGSEIKKTRPCVIISPDEMNRHLKTLLVAPMTTVLRKYPSRVKILFQKTEGQVALDQLRSIDRQRLIKKLGRTSLSDAKKISHILGEMFQL